MQTMAKLPYHYGTKFRIFPSRQQKELIQLNSDISRTIYNKLIAIDREIFQLAKVKIPLAQIKQRIKTLNHRKKMKNLANHYIYMNNKKIDSLAKLMPPKTIKGMENVP